MASKNFNLKKGEVKNISAAVENLKKVTVGLGWDPKDSVESDEYDLDACCFMLDTTGKMKQDEHFIYYNNLKSPCGSVVHMGDNLTGQGSGDDEQIRIDLSVVPKSVTKLVFAVSIYEAEKRGQNFGQIDNSFIRLVNGHVDKDCKEGIICKYDLQDDYSTADAIVFGELYRSNLEWKFKAVGKGYSGGVAVLIDRFGTSP